MSQFFSSFPRTQTIVFWNEQASRVAGSYGHRIWTSRGKWAIIREKRKGLQRCVDCQALGGIDAGDQAQPFAGPLFESYCPFLGCR